MGIYSFKNGFSIVKIFSIRPRFRNRHTGSIVWRLLMRLLMKPPWKGTPRTSFRLFEILMMLKNCNKVQPKFNISGT